jgi:tetratricopeptide (TPR) repeat protein
MNTLIIRHNPKTSPPTFQVEEKGTYNSTTSQPVSLPSPFEFQSGIPNTSLMQGLQWYLEQFLSYPFPPDTDKKDKILQALEQWGVHVFDALFDNRDAGMMYGRAISNGLTELQLQISSDDPGILAWPWEALQDSRTGTLAHLCQIERVLNKIEQPLPLSSDLPGDRLNILMVTARPYQQDVGLRSVSRPLVDLIHEGKLPAEIHILRPPTFENLKDHLRAHPNYYHILHFDGHGGYSQTPASDGYTYKGHMGCLVFENNDGQENLVTADKLSVLLREHDIPAVVLNACQSAMIHDEAEDPFAMVAASMIKAGIRSVTAMAYSLYVSGAKVFLPAFYKGLFQTGKMPQAVRMGRQEMLEKDVRMSSRGEFPLKDWVLPVLYQQAALDFSFAIPKKQTAKAPQLSLDDQAEKSFTHNLPNYESIHGCIGRDSDMLQLERGMRKSAPVLLIHGMGGIGKTTLALGFLEWLAKTGGLENEPFWFSFQEIMSAEYVINRMGEKIFGTQFNVIPMNQKINHLGKALCDYPFWVVWDNFESVHGMSENNIKGRLSETDQDILNQLIKKLIKGKSKIIMTSRSKESWLRSEHRIRINLSGLAGEEQWEFCQTILSNMGITINRKDPELIALMNMLHGHPLSMRVILPLLENRSARDIQSMITENLNLMKKETDPAQQHLFAILRFIETDLPDHLQPLLIPLSFHEAFVHGEILKSIVEKKDASLTQSVPLFLKTLCHAGLMNELPGTPNVFQLHPALTGYLRGYLQVDNTTMDAWAASFVDITGRIASGLAPKQLHEQRFMFHLYGASFNYGLRHAMRLNMLIYASAFLKAIGTFAQNSLDYDAARDAYTRWSEVEKQRGNKEEEAASYHQLGMIAEKQRDFAAAESWYRKSLEINEKQGNENGAAATYDQLGSIALEQRDFAAAESWYRKSLEINEKQGNEHGAASTYHQLGRIAEEQRDFAAAESWYRKSLDINEKIGNEHVAAMTYHQLGRIAEEQRDFAAAESWYRKSLEISEKQGNEHGAANTYHQLGILAEEQRDFAAAESWYRKSLEIFEKQCNEHGAAMTYHQLGLIAQEQRDFTAAESWYRKSLEISEKQGNEHGAANTFCQLGILAALQIKFEEAGQWLIKSILVFARCNDNHNVQVVANNFMILYKQSPIEIQEKLKSMWEKSLGEFPKQE